MEITFIDRCEFALFISVLIPYYVMGILHAIKYFKKPKLKFSCYSNGVLYRHFDFKRCKNWGIICINGLLSVKYKQVAVIGAKVSYYMKEEDLHGCLNCGDGFPPKIEFDRIKQDGNFCVGDADLGDINFILSPHGGVIKTGRLPFAMYGNFATEYGEDFFDHKLNDDELFIVFYIKFQYQYNGELYWSEEFPVHTYAYSDKIYTEKGSQHIDENTGEPIKIHYFQGGEVNFPDEEISHMLKAGVVEEEV